MRRTLSALILAAALSGCGAVGSSLPYRAGSLDDSMGMTIEQYAVGRLPAGGRMLARCAKPSEHAAKTAHDRAARERAAKRTRQACSR